MKAKPSAFIVFIPGFPKDESDSTCLPAQQHFILKLKELYPLIKIIVISFQYPFEAGTYKWNKVTVTSFGGKNRGGLSRLLLWNRVRRHFKALLSEYQVKGLLSFWLGETALLGSSLSKKYSIPHFCWLMGQDARSDNKYVSRISPSAYELIAISDFVAGETERNHRLRPRHIIPLGIDPKIFGSDHLSRSIDILGAGSLIPLKRFEILVRVVKHLSVENKNIRAVICGNGPEKEKLLNLVRELNLGSNIQLAGERSHKEVVELMKKTRLLLHPSSYEGFGMVCLEALGAGAKVLSFTRAMKNDIPNWNIVEKEEDMVTCAKEILSAASAYEPVVPFRMEDSVHSVMKLFL